MIGVKLLGRTREEDAVHASIVGIACEIATRGMFKALSEICGSDEDALSTATRIARMPVARARAEEFAAAAVQGMLGAMSSMQLAELEAELARGSEAE